MTAQRSASPAFIQIRRVDFPSTFPSCRNFDITVHFHGSFGAGNAYIRVVDRDTGRELARAYLMEPAVYCWPYGAAVRAIHMADKPILRCRVEAYSRDARWLPYHRDAVWEFQVIRGPPPAPPPRPWWWPWPLPWPSS